MRRKNKPRVVWLPDTNISSVDQGQANRSAINFFAFTNSTGVQGGFSSDEFPVVQDGSQSSPLDPTASLSDIENSGYRLRRIVGEIYIDAVQDSIQNFSLFQVTAAFIIRRVDPDTGLSIVSSSAAAQNSMNPDDIDSNMDPWIWRRSWRMSNDGPVQNDNTDFFREPHNNYGRYTAGGLFTGPHVDQKTARIVGPEERLFLNVSATHMLNPGASNPTTFLVATSLRVLASMRTSIGNRRNASR